MSSKKEFNAKYSPEFKISVIMDMREHNMGYRETARKYWGDDEKQAHNHMHSVKRWERIYLEEGEAGLMAEHRGRKSTGRPRKKPLEPSVEEDLIAENQRLKEQNEWLRMENAYLKKLDALVLRDEQLYGKKRKP